MYQSYIKKKFEILSLICNAGVYRNAIYLNRLFLSIYHAVAGVDLVDGFIELELWYNCTFRV